MFGTVLGFEDFLWIFVLMVIAVFWLTVYLRPHERARLSRLEGKLDLLLKHAGLTYDPKVTPPPGVLEAVQRGEQMRAIKLYRQATGSGLGEAMDFIEGLAKQVQSARERGAEQVYGLESQERTPRKSTE